jgi:hypothetical protein
MSATGRSDPLALKGNGNEHPARSQSETPAASTIHQHGDFGVRQHLVRFAADHESRYPAPPVGSHENYVATSFRRGLDNFFPWMVTDLVDRPVVDPRPLGGLLYDRQALVSDGLRVLGVGVLRVLEWARTEPELAPGFLVRSAPEPRRLVDRVGA